jgi:hypothetical protein
MLGWYEDLALLAPFAHTGCTPLCVFRISQFSGWTYLTHHVAAESNASLFSARWFDAESSPHAFEALDL